MDGNKFSGGRRRVEGGKNQIRSGATIQRHIRRGRGDGKVQVFLGGGANNRLRDSRSLQISGTFQEGTMTYARAIKGSLFQWKTERGRSNYSQKGGGGFKDSSS